MTIARLVCSFFAVLLLTAPICIMAQDTQSVQPSHGIRVAVSVDTKTGQPVTSLAQNDFTILDNQTQRPITSFKVVSEPVHVILLLDAIDMPYQALASARQGIERYLKSHEGTLPHPTTLAILTGHGAQIANRFSTNGNALSDTLHSQQIGLPQITHDLKISLNAFNQVAEFAAGIPGRKVHRTEPLGTWT